MSVQALRDTTYANELVHGSIKFPSAYEGRIERLRFKEGVDHLPELQPERPCDMPDAAKYNQGADVKNSEILITFKFMWILLLMLLMGGCTHKSYEKTNPEEYEKFWKENHFGKKKFRF
jgi:hypothetical protein